MDRDGESGCLTALGQLALLGLIALPLSAVQAWALWLCWGWFVVPLGIEQIGAAHVLGLSTLGSLAWSSTYVPEADLESPFQWRVVWLRSLMYVMKILMGLGIAWLAHALM